MSDAPAPAEDIPERHHAGGLVAYLAIATITALVMIYFVVPGFVAAFWSYFAHRDVFSGLERPETPAEKLLFTPAEILCSYRRDYALDKPMNFCDFLAHEHETGRFEPLRNLENLRR